MEDLLISLFQNETNNRIMSMTFFWFILFTLVFVIFSIRPTSIRLSNKVESIDKTSNKS